MLLKRIVSTVILVFLSSCCVAAASPTTQQEVLDAEIEEIIIEEIEVDLVDDFLTEDVRPVMIVEEINLTDSSIPEEKKDSLYNENDVYLLSHLIQGESGICSDEMQLYVGSVVLNRVKSELFPNTIKEVIYQKGQYACVKDGNFDTEVSEQVLKNTIYLLENGSILPDNIIWQAEFKQGKGVYEKIDNMYFCY